MTQIRPRNTNRGEKRTVQGHLLDPNGIRHPAFSRIPKEDPHNALRVSTDVAVGPNWLLQDGSAGNIGIHWNELGSCCELPEHSLHRDKKSGLISDFGGFHLENCQAGE